MSDPIEPGAGRCLNCEQPLQGEFCSHCGQRDLPTRLGLGELLREVASESFDLDGRVTRTIVPFLVRPGLLSREYNAGRRARYTAPFRMFLAMTFLWLVASFVANALEPAASVDESAAQLELDLAEEDADEAARAKSEFAEQSALARWMIQQGQTFEALPPTEQVRRLQAAGRETLPKAALLMVPVFALLMKLLFIRQRRYYVEHLVFALYLHAFAFLLLAIGVLIGVDLLGVGLVLGFLVYLYVGLWKGYEARWWTSLVRLLAIVTSYSIMLAMATAVLLLFTLLMD